jgi:hypothetical protein
MPTATAKIARMSQESSNFRRRSRPFSFWIVVGLTACVLILWLLVGMLPWWLAHDHNEASQFGDSFGFGNTLFAGLAFAGVIYAIILQTEELRLQREELEETRDELKRSADAQEQTQQALYLSAYLNAAASMMEGLEPLVANERHSNFKPDTAAYRQLLAEMRIVLSELRTEAKGFVQIPDTVTTVRDEILRLATYADLAADAHQGTPEAQWRLILQSIPALQYRLLGYRKMLSIDVDAERELQVSIDEVIAFITTAQESARDDTGQQRFTETHYGFIRPFFQKLTDKLKSLGQRE